MSFRFWSASVPGVRGFFCSRTQLTKCSPARWNDHPHTDNPYRDPVPSLQLLHCLSSSDIGGDSTVVDGFCVADALRDREPDKFKLLTTMPVRVRFSDKDTELEAEVTLISLNPRGDVVAVRLNGPTALPFDFDSDLMVPYYVAYRTFGLMLESPEFQVRFKLEPGDLYIFDNARVMHGRTEFSGEGNRHLHSCYADRDGLYNRLAVLNRTKSVSTVAQESSQPTTL